MVDTARYPIDDLQSAPGQELIQRCQQQLDAHGVASLPEFLLPAAVASSVSVANDVADRAWHADQEHNVYFTNLAEANADASVPASHPVRRPIRSSQWAVAYDLLPPELPLRTVYESDEILRFLEAVLEERQLFRSIDPLDALEVSYFKPGDELGWHFDNSEFSVTMMLQEPDAGGDFEYHPGIRTVDGERYDQVELALDGQTAPLRLPTGPGTLAIFQGRHALHRVSVVQGDTTRINSVFTFGTEPDMCLSPLTQELFYGRRVPAS